MGGSTFHHLYSKPSTGSVPSGQLRQAGDRRQQPYTGLAPTSPSVSLGYPAYPLRPVMGTRGQPSTRVAPHSPPCSLGYPGDHLLETMMETGEENSVLRWHPPSLDSSRDPSYILETITGIHRNSPYHLSLCQLGVLWSPLRNNDGDRMGQPSTEVALISPCQPQGPQLLLGDDDGDVVIGAMGTGGDNKVEWHPSCPSSSGCPSHALETMMGPHYQSHWNRSRRDRAGRCCCCLWQSQGCRAGSES